MLVFVVLSFGIAPVLLAQEILTPVAMTGSETQWFAYADHQVWHILGGTTFQEYPPANRGLPVTCMIPYPVGILILYEDNQVWHASESTGFTFWADVSRVDDPDAQAILICICNGCGLRVAYDDGQIWAYSEPGGLRHLPQFERLNPLSEVDERIERIAPTVSPNPSVGECEIEFALKTAAPVSVVILDVSGRLIRHLLDGPHPAGDYSLIWDGRDDDGREVPAGIYFARMVTSEAATTGRIVLAK